ncbi:MAG: hypothetical protein WDZ51_00945 [Pirellulaceae bacterium]
MTAALPRLRMFAGPNGSGKTTIKVGLNRPSAWFGNYINPDDIEGDFRNHGGFPAHKLDVEIDIQKIRDFFFESPFLQKLGLNDVANSIQLISGRIAFSEIEVNSYHASVLCDYLRQRCVENSQSFSFETVMSAWDKVDLLRQAQQSGFRTYLYYVATEDPAINISRVKFRVTEGGHDVPESKIVARYHRSLGLLPEAIRHTNRAFFFDTSEETPWFFGEATEGKSIELKTTTMPLWFQPIWDQF